MTYLELSGVMLNILLVLLSAYVLWQAVIFPAIEAVSMCRWYAAIWCRHPYIRPRLSWFYVWWQKFELFGRDFISISNSYGRWEGVGKWSVYESNE